MRRNSAYDELMGRRPAATTAAASPAAKKTRKAKKTTKKPTKKTRKSKSGFNVGAYSRARAKALKAGKSKEQADAAGKRAAKRGAPKKGGKKGAKKAKKSAKRRLAPVGPRVRKVRVSGSKKVVTAFGKYTRVRMVNPATGRREYSYMYKAKGGKLRHIPFEAMTAVPSYTTKTTKKGKKVKVRTVAHSISAAKKIIAARKRITKQLLHATAKPRTATHNLPFVPNAMKKNKKSRKARKAPKGAKSLWTKLVSKYGAKKASSLYSKKTGGLRKGASKRIAKLDAKKTTRKVSRKRKTTKRTVKRTRKVTRKVTRRRAAKRTTKRTRKVSRRRSTKRTTRRTRKSTRKTARRTTKRTRKAARRRSTRRSTRRSSRRRSYRRNSIGAALISALKLGALAFVGFGVHRALTVLAQQTIMPMLKPAGTSGFDMATFEKPLVGLGVLAVGVPLSSLVKGNAGAALGAGMVASWLQSLAVSVANALEASSAVQYLEGYTDSAAYQLRGYSSLMPEYAPVSGFGAYEQAAAGYEQAAAGFEQAAAGFEQAAAGFGEYFTPNALGEYFAPNGLEGVGAYEPAGPLALQAAAGFGQTIDDGIRPDSNLDAMLDLAESAAGLNGPMAQNRARAMGEYITAKPIEGGGFEEDTVGTSSQWIPSGPLWAGELGVKDKQPQADLPAGVLAGPGGNGILSGR